MTARPFKRLYWFLAFLIPAVALAQNAGSGPGANPSDPDLAAGVRPSTIRVLSPGDHLLFVRAFAAAAKGDWAQATALGDQGSDTAARQLLQWRYTLDRNSGAKFADIDATMKFAATWPLKSTLAARAEAAIIPDPSGANGMTPSHIISWFAGREPSSSIGRIRLGEALVASGQIAKGGPLIARGWMEGSFDDSTENTILAQDGAYLTPESDKARLDNLLWRGETAAARRQMTRVDAATAAIARARIMLGGGTKAAQPALNAVTDSSNPALLFDWARALRTEHRDDEAHSMLMRVVPITLARDHAAQWWAEVSVEARDMLKDGDAKGALGMVDHAALPIGDPYTEQQFLGGFICLRFLKDPARALVYFQRLTANVSRPISKSRAEYWQGRAYEGLGDTVNALAHYRLAAAYPETFYGQIALTLTNNRPILHINDVPVAAAPKSEIENDLLMPQIHVLAELGQTLDLLLFAQEDVQVYSSPAHLKTLLQALTDWGYPDVAVRLAKTASYDGVTMLAFTHPLVPLPVYQGPGAAPDPALVLGLIRQETEFDPYAVSNAGALGLMQVMSFTAKKSARIAHLPYRPGDLLTDRDYNIQLGMIEFAGHVSHWNGSLVLAAAAYNAGDANANRWVTTYGDPRTTSIDPIDFIEQIPFGETRNYVQRVLENAEVYRNRLAGKDLPLQIAADLYAPIAAPTATIGTPVGK